MLYRGPITYAHRTFSFNAHLDSAGAEVQGSVSDAAIIDECPINTTYRDLRDPLHLVQGAQLGRIHKGMTIIQPSGRIVVPQGATSRVTVEDRKRAFLAAFDPYLCYIDSPSTEGAYHLDFYEGTGDTTDFSAGYIAARYYCRPASKPRVLETARTRTTLPFQVALIAPDPRMYAQTGISLALSPSTLSGDLTNLGLAPAPLKLTIVMAGAGSSSFTLSDGTTSFVLDLSGCASGDTVVVVMEDCGPYGAGRLITTNGSETFSLKTSGAETWLVLPADGSTTFTISDTTNVTSCTIASVSAWP